MTTRSAFFLRADGTLAIQQAAGDVLDYRLDLTDLLSDGDAIQTTTWAATGGVTIDSPAQDATGVSAFIVGTSGSVTRTVTTVLGRRKMTAFCIIPEPVAFCG